MVNGTYETRGRAGRPVTGAVLLAAVVLAAVGCGSTPDLEQWRATWVVPREDASTAMIERDLQTVESLRGSGRLEESRRLALMIVAEHPDDLLANYVASRAESDEVFRLVDGTKADRNAAAWSALDFSRRAMAAFEESGQDAAAEPPVDLLAQHAYAMGAATHLRGMFARAGHARATLSATERALDRDPGHPVALATRATLELRLATLPWIAKTMAVGAPRGSLERANLFARQAADRRPSIENRLLLAKVLQARDQDGDRIEARDLLRETLDRPDRFPRDAALRGEASELLASLGGS